MPRARILFLSATGLVIYVLGVVPATALAAWVVKPMRSALRHAAALRHDPAPGRRAWIQTLATAAALGATWPLWVPAAIATRGVAWIMDTIRL